MICKMWKLPKNIRKLLRNCVMSTNTSFSTDSSDIGKTHLIEMKIDIGNSP